MFDFFKEIYEIVKENVEYHLAQRQVVLLLAKVDRLKIERPIIYRERAEDLSVRARNILNGHISNV